MQFFSKKDFIETLRLAVPVIIGQLGQVLMGNIDTLMLGKIGAVAVSAAGLAGSVFILIAVLGFGVTGALAPLVATANAIGDSASCRKLLIQGVWAAGLLGSLMTLVCFFSPLLWRSKAMLF